MKPNPKIVSAVVGGLIATAIVTLLAVVGPAFSPSPIDFATMVTSLVLSPASQPFILAFAIHLVSGSLIFPLIYVFLVHPVLPGRPWLRGLIFGTGLWVLVQLILLPIVGLGPFSSRAPSPVMAAGSSLLTHLLYGVILGAIASPRLARAVEEETETKSGRRYG
jgi:uncharacterized membrane protein YagU involved in acid resistance